VWNVRPRSREAHPEVNGSWMAIGVEIWTELSTETRERYYPSPRPGGVTQETYYATILSPSSEQGHVERHGLRRDRRRKYSGARVNSLHIRPGDQQQPGAGCTSPLAKRLWALTAQHKQSHCCLSEVQLLPSCSMTGRENGPALTWCEAYGPFGQVFRSSSCAVNRSTPCRHAGMPVECTLRHGTAGRKAYLCIPASDCGAAMRGCRRSASLRAA
jgi:hypothetical protein